MSEALQQIEDRIEEIENDSRFQAEPADVYVNSVLALIQTDLQAEYRTLEWVQSMIENKH